MKELGRYKIRRKLIFFRRTRDLEFDAFEYCKRKKIIVFVLFVPCEQSKTRRAHLKKQTVGENSRFKQCIIYRAEQYLRY